VRGERGRSFKEREPAVVRLKAGVLAEPVLVGREHELEELQRYLDSAVGGKGSTVFISGEAGSGKTRLTSEFLKVVKEKGVTILYGWCLSNVAVPYFPFVEAFKSYFAATESECVQNEGQEINAWLMGLKQAEKPRAYENLTPQVWKDLTFAAVAKSLSSISDRKPTVLFIEDIHWADSASLSLLHYIARTTSSERIFVLATFRSEELTADAEGHPHPLAEELRLMRREDLITEMKLPNLNQTDVTKIAENMMGGSLHPGLVSKLAQESRGNALYVVESLRMLSERGSLYEENGQWRLSVDALGIPSKFKDIIMRRLTVLKFNQRRTLDAASVIGEKVDVELLGAVLGQDTLEVLETLNMVAQSTSLVCVEENLFRFDHAKSREAIYGEIPMPLKRGYHARVAEMLESTSRGGRLPFSEIAYHYAQAGNREKAVKFAMAAGQDALARFSNAEAIKHFTYVLQAVAEDRERAEERLGALEGLGDAFYANSMFKESMRMFEQLGDTAKTGVVKLRAYRKAMESAFQHGDAPRLIELVKKAEPYVAADRLDSARVIFSRGRAFLIQGMYSENLENYEAALQVFEEEYSLWDAAWTLLGIGVTQSILGMPPEAITAALRSIALFEELGDFRGQMEAYFAAGVTFNMCFLEHEALDLLAKISVIDEKMRMGDYIRLFHANDVAAKSFLQMGDFEKALSYCLKALELSKKTDSMWANGSVYADLTMEHALHGDLKNAEEFFEKLMRLPPEVLTLLSAWGVLPKAVLFAGKSRWKESNQYFKECFEWLKDHPIPAEESVAKLFYAWSLERQGRFEEAKVQLEENRRIRREAEARFEHANVQASLMVRRQVVVGEEFEMRLDLVNVGRKPALLVKIENVLPEDFKVAALPSWCSMQNRNIEMKGREIGAFQVESVKLGLKGLKAGAFTLVPQAVYVDDQGETKTCRLNTVNIAVRQAPPKVRPGRVSSGMAELDDLLLGGIPGNYSVILTAASSDERELLIKRFLETAAQAGQTTLYLTTEVGNAKALAETFPASFSLFICSPQAELMTENLTNICRLKGVDNLTEIDIALAKYSRTLDPSKEGPRIACVQIVSDVLLQHHAVIARKWLGSLLANLKSKGFTTLAVIDPHMHPPEEAQAVLGLFDGEIRIANSESAKGREKVLKILKLYNQRYLENELFLTKEKLLQS
jgi:tetratricopeptide (TPR) repeat protein/KaiC/GvpD/RAD55 family RecA-like ATPase